MGTGMGIPSAGIYITELIRFFDRENASCAWDPVERYLNDVALRDVVLAVGACTDSGTNRSRYFGWDFAATADFGLLRSAADAATDRGLHLHVGNVHSSDVFYNPTPDIADKWDSMGVLAVEMEAAGLYGIAAARARAGARRADGVPTTSARTKKTSSDERERTFNDMIDLALAGLAADSKAG